jgi:hypothetical protein
LQFVGKLVHEHRDMPGDEGAGRLRFMAVKEDIRRILTDQHCRSIDFTIAGLRVNGAGLGQVAEYIRDGRIALCERSDMSTPGRYRMTRDEMHVRSDLSDDLDDSNKRSLIVHEAVHALADIRRLSGMTNAQSESSGFIAQALYRLKYRNGRTWNSRVAIFREALAVVLAKKLHEQSNVTVQWNDYAALRSAIHAHPNYRDDDPEASAGATGVRGHAGRRCSF